MTERRRCLLTCGCVRVVENPLGKNGYLCVNHGYQTILAIETREWHIACQDCRYGRWLGEDKANARILIKKHNDKTGHHFTMDYITPEDTKRRWRKIYGNQRTPRRYIILDYSESIAQHSPRKSNPIPRASEVGEEPPF